MRRIIAIAATWLALSGAALAQCSGGITGCPQANTVGPTDFFIIAQQGGTGPTGYVTRKATGTQVAAGLLANSFAAPTATIGLTTVPGSASTGIRSDGAPALSQAITPVWTGLHTFTASPTAAIFNGNLDIIGAATLIITPTPSNPTTQGIFVQQFGTSGSIAGAVGFPFYYLGSPYFVYNTIQVLDQLNVTGTHVMAAAWAVGMEVGGANSQGSKFALEASIVKDIAGSNPTQLRDIAAGNFDAYASVGDGGTGTSVGTAKGTLFAAGLQIVLASGATNLLTAAGGEINVSIMTGASAASRFGMSAVSTGNLNGATAYDAGFEVSSFAGSPGWKVGLLFSSFHGGPAVNTNGTLIGNDAVATTALNGVDFSFDDFNGGFFLKGGYTHLGTPGTPNFTVSGLGAVVGTMLTTTVTGSAGAPNLALQVCGSGCGWYSPASGQMAWSVGGVPIMDFGFTASTFTFDVNISFGNHSAYGGGNTNSSMNFFSTFNGAPSGDLVNFFASGFQFLTTASAHLADYGQTFANAWTFNAATHVVGTFTSPSLISTFAGGIQIGTPTGGDKGAGTLNVASTIWTNGTQGITKSCLFNTANVTTGITLTITNGLITGTTTC